MKFRFSFLIFFSFLFVIFTISLFLRYKFSHKESFVIQPNIGIVSMMKNPKNIETWLKIHRNLGIKRFYIRLEDTPELVEFLKSQSDVKTDISQSTGVNEYVEIQNRQAKMVDKALQDGRNDGIDWLIHIDSDEILKGNLEEIANLPETTRTFWMQNYEALYSNVPAEEDNCFRAKKFVNCSVDKCVSYANGKGGGRTTVDVSVAGPHRFQSSQEDNAPRLNMIVEHYESCDFEKYKEKYLNLSKQTTNNNIPFPYYNDSIAAAKKGGEEDLKKTYIKYRVAN